MRKLVLHLDAGIAGTDTAEAYLVPDDVTENELDDFAWERAIDHAQSFGMYPESERPEDCDEDEKDSYTDNIEGWFEEYNAKEHDCILTYGANSTFEWNEF